MRLRIRQLTRLRSGGTSATDHVVEVPGDRIRVGRGTDNELFLKDLRVNYRHAEIVVREHDVVVEAAGGEIRLDEVPVERAVLGPGETVGIGPYRVQVLADEPDADLTVTYELAAPPPGETPEQLIRPERVQVRGGRRAWAWILFVVVILGSLAVPVVAHLMAKSEPDEPVAGREGLPLLAGLDRLWVSGELSSSHKQLNEDCGACHERAFVPVREEACLACHQATEHHFETARFTFANFEPVECMDCHTEHVGPDGVVPAQQKLCGDCHADLEATQSETTLLDVTDFGTDHPEFRPSVITDPASGEVQRVALGAQTFPQEKSNLRFPHDIHLAEICRLKGENAIPADQASEKDRDACTVLQMAAQRMTRPDGLVCADCHQPEPGGVNMLPVDMRQHCAECHRLEFDPAAPGRVLPHGQPEEVIAVINDFYAAELLRRGSSAQIQAAQASAQSLRQRPGGSTAGAAPSAAPQPAPDPLAEAIFVSRKKLDDVFGRQLCGVCHEVLTPEQSPLGRFEVLPVQVAALWMPKARFDHAAHTTSTCTDCHEATTSPTSTDVLMPAIATCRDCHLGEHAARALPSTCIMCHDYHREDQAPMSPAALQAAHAGMQSVPAGDGTR